MKALKAPTALELRRVRNQLGYSQQQFARFLHIDQATFSRWETGMTRIPFIMRFAIEWMKINLHSA